MDLKNISEFISSGGDQHHSGTGTTRHLGAVEEHSPMPRVDLSQQLLLNPLDKEVRDCLGLDSFLCLKLDIQGKEFNPHFAT